MNATCDIGPRVLSQVVTRYNGRSSTHIIIGHKWIYDIFHLLRSQNKSYISRKSWPDLPIAGIIPRRFNGFINTICSYTWRHNHVTIARKADLHRLDSNVTRCSGHKQNLWTNGIYFTARMFNARFVRNYTCQTLRLCSVKPFPCKLY